MESRLVREFLNEVVPKIKFLWYKQKLLLEKKNMSKYFEEIKSGTLEKMKAEHPKFVEDYISLMTKVIENSEEHIRNAYTFDELIENGECNRENIENFFSKNNKDYQKILLDIRNRKNNGEQINNEELEDFLTEWGEQMIKKDALNEIIVTKCNSPLLETKNNEKLITDEQKKELE